MNLHDVNRSFQRFMGVLAALLGLLGLSGLAGAAASYCTATYAINSAASNQIGVYNYVTNTITPAFPAASTNSNAITQSPTNGNLYYIDRANNTFHKLDVNTSVDTNVGTVNLPSTLVGGTTDASGNYYIYLNNGSFAQVNVAAAGNQTVTYTNFVFPAGYALTATTNGDFAIDSTGQAYVVAQVGTVAAGSGFNPGTFLWKLNLTNGALTAPVPFRTNATTQWAAGNTTNGLSIDPANGNVLISSGTGDGTGGAGVYSINPASGVTTFKVADTTLTDLGTCAVLPNTPTITKSFAPNTVSGAPATSTLTITVGNSNLAPLYLQSALTDALPTTPGNMVVATPNGLGGTCTAASVTATAGSNTITLAAGAKIPAGGCTISVNVQVPTYGNYVNNIQAGALNTTAGSNAAAASATLSNAVPYTATTPPVCSALAGSTGVGANLITDFSNGTFGVSGTDPTIAATGTKSPTAWPYSAANIPNYTYIQVNTNAPNDGNLSLVSRLANPRIFNLWSNSLTPITTDAAGIASSDLNTGRFLIVNGANPGQPVLTTVVNGLTANTNYQIAGLIANLIDNGATGYSLPNLEFYVNGVSYAKTGNIAQDNVAQWRRNGFVFNSGNSTSVTLQLVSNVAAGAGNDFGFDQLELDQCQGTFNNTLSGYLYGDMNKNSSFQNTNEPQLPAGVKVDLQYTDVNGNTVTVAKTTTGVGVDTGRYVFTNVPPAPTGRTYFVHVEDGSVAGEATTIPVGYTLFTTNNAAIPGTPNYTSGTNVGPDFGFTTTADVAINKTGPALVTQNGSVSYTLKVWNLGPAAVGGVTIADSVPANLTSVTWSCAASGSATCGTASGTGNAISFPSGLLPVNNSATAPTTGSYLTITVTGTATTAGNITNTATVTSSTGNTDGAAANNSSSQATTINTPPTTTPVINTVLVNTAAATVLSPNLSATDADGTIATYTIATIPTTASGVLALNGTAVTAGQTFNANQLGNLTFDPAAGFSGNATFTYAATDNQGATSNTSVYTIPVNNLPTTSPVTNAVLLDTALATVLNPNLSAADTDGTIASYTIVTLPTAASGVLSVNGAAVTAGQTFTAAQLGTLSFKPVVGFNGNASFTYSATDNQGGVSNTSTYNIPVNVAPVAVNDTSSTPANTAKTLSITGNDTDTAPGTVNITTTLFATSGQPTGSTLSNGNRSIAVPNEGTYTLDNAGNVTFTPVAGYSGTTTAVKYTVQDNQGATSNVASITVTVTPVATNDVASTAPSALVNIPVLNNDLGKGKVLTSLLFPAGQPAGSTVMNGSKTLTNADGVYTIKTDGTVDFTPALGKTGTLTPVLYTFVDGAGQTSNAATITVTVGAITPPTATNDSKTTPKNTAVSLEGSTNDTAGSLPIDNTSVVLTAGGTITNAGKTLTNAQGTYQVQTNGMVLFTPVAAFAGTTAPVSYTVKDTSGATSNTATLTVTVNNQPPVANSLTNTLVTSTAPAAALNPGVSGTDADGTVVTYTVTTLPTPAMGTLYCNGTAIAGVPSPCAPAQLSFKPDPAFNGNATFQYTVTDDNGATSNVATYTIPVNKPPVAVNDSGATDPNVNVTFSVTGNDTDTAPGTVDVTTTAFDPSSTGTLSNGNKTLTVNGQGVFTLDNTGKVTFAPAPGFNNGTSTAKYTVRDNNGAVSNVATITVNVPASVDLAITKSGPAYFKPGDTLSYTLTVTNGGSAATGVTVTDTLPAGLTFVSASNGGTYNAGTGKASWTVGAVANGATVTLTLTGTAPLAASVETNNGPTSLANTAAAQGNETEAVTANNSATSTAQLVYPKLTKRVRNVTQNGAFGTVGTGKPAEVLEYCIDFKNYGVAVASFVVSDTVPGNTTANLSGYGAGLGLRVVRGSATTTRTSTGTDADGGSLSSAALSLDLGTLAAGESGSVCFQASIK